jgi:hypothetical protein
VERAVDLVVERAELQVARLAAHCSKGSFRFSA